MHIEEFSHLSFSKREGIIDLPEPMKLGELSNVLRVDISNYLESRFEYIQKHSHTSEEYNAQLVNIFSQFHEKGRKHYKEKYSLHPFNPSKINIELITEYHSIVTGKDLNTDNFKYPFNRVLDFLELIFNRANRLVILEGEEIKDIFEKHQAAYTLHYFESKNHYNFHPITSEANKIAVEKNLDIIETSGYGGAINYLIKAIDAFKKQDYEVVIKESYAAIEAIGEDITDKKQLSGIIKVLKSKTNIDERLLTGIEKFTSFAHDFRHGKEQDKKPKITQNEALLIFGIHAAIASYFAAKSKEKKK